MTTSRIKRVFETNNRRGFTLLEVLLVVGILVALAAILVPSLVGVQEGAKLDQAKLRVNLLEQAFERYNVTVGNFPTTQQGVAVLVSPPSPPPERWRGPYIKDPNLLDPWDQPYNYQYPGTRNLVGPDLWSNGPDRASGSADDIGNWPTGQ